jgi:preprotein translocase subunit SecD
LNGPQAQATDLADALKYGSLPLDFQLLAENSVSDQVGHISLVAGLAAGITSRSATCRDSPTPSA